jgi:hypothetical protein
MVYSHANFYQCKMGEFMDILQEFWNIIPGDSTLRKLVAIFTGISTTVGVVAVCLRWLHKGQALIVLSEKYKDEFKDVNFDRPIYVAGDFNGWLQAEDGKLHVDEEIRRVYSLSKNDNKIRLKLPKGKYEFKFVTEDGRWLEWRASSGYQRGDYQPGGPNLALEVE